MSIEYIVNKYTNLIYKICLDMLSSSPDAQDMSQEVFLSFYLHMEEYISLPENDIKNILCKIALNKCKDYLKSKSYKLKLLTNDDETDLANYEEDNNILEEIIKQDSQNYIQKIINELKEPYNDILYCYYIDCLSLDEISSKLNIAKPTLKVQIYRGKKILKEKLEGDYGGGFISWKKN